MTSFHRPDSESTAKDHPEQKKVKKFARCIERLYPREQIRRFDYRGIYRKEEELNREIQRRNEMVYAYPFINTTRYLRERFRCETCCQIGLHPNKYTVREQTKFCDKCFEQNAMVNNLDFSINLPISLHDNANFGKIHYERTTKPMVKKALEKVGYETTRVIRRIGEIEEVLTLICEIYRYIILNTEKFHSSDYCDYYIYCLEQYRDNYWRVCKNLKKYLSSLPEIENNYTSLQESQSRKDMCSGCFRCKHELTTELKNTKKGMLCKECEMNETIKKRMRIREKNRLDAETKQEKVIGENDEFEKLKFIIKAECPICNETFREFDPKQMMQSACGRHSFCIECATNWRKACIMNTQEKQATCPMCRGDF